MIAVTSAVSSDLSHGCFARYGSIAGLEISTKIQNGGGVGKLKHNNSCYYTVAKETHAYTARTRNLVTTAAI